MTQNWGKWKKIVFNLLFSGASPNRKTKLTNPSLQYCCRCFKYLFVKLIYFLLFILAFYCAFLSLSSKTTSPKFLNYWIISRNLGLDVANKLISSCFAILSSTSGIFVLLTYGSDYYWGQTITYIMPIGMGYFLYDTYAMFIVYQSNNQENCTKSKEEFKKKSFMSFVCYQPLIVAHHLLLSFFFIPLMGRFSVMESSVRDT